MNFRSLASLITTICLGMGATLAQQPGTLDLSFHPDPGTGSQVESVALQPDGKVLVGGWFINWGGSGHARIVRLNADGSLDTSFDPGAGANDIVFSTVVQPDGKVLIGGGFTTYNGTARNRIARLNTDGSLDNGFDPISGVYGLVRSVVLQPNGRILIGGEVLSYDGVPRGKLARINADATLDTTFNPGGLPFLGGQIYSMALQPDGKVLVGGEFSGFSGMPRKSIVRLDADGSVDIGFDPGSGFNGAFGQIYSMALQPDGKVIVGGAFDSYDGTPCSNIIRLNTDGSLDTGFDPGTGANLIVWSTVVQPDGKIIIGGQFTNYNGTTRNRIARLNADGSLDSGFDPGSGANTNIRTVALQPDGKILIGGDFGNYDGVPRGMVARILGVEVPQNVTVAVRAFMEGPYSPGTGLMHDSLRSHGLIPLTEPYTDLGYDHVGGGGETTISEVLTTTGPNAIVDWVVVELRDKDAPANVLQSRSALVQRDGDVVGMDGASSVSFTLPPDEYHVAVRHRNHLGVMTGSATALGLSTTPLDLSLASTATFGNAARKSITGTFPVEALWAGDVNGDGVIKYAGSGNDRDPILTTVGGTVPTNTVSGQYRREDVNLNGVVQYAGSGNDRDIILQNVGGTVPTNTRQAQLP